MNMSPNCKLPITEIKIQNADLPPVKAFVSMKLANTMCLTGIRIVNGSKGLFISMPARKTPQGEYQDIFHPASREIRDELQKEILNLYQKLETSIQK